MKTTFAGANNTEFPAVGTTSLRVEADVL